MKSECTKNICIVKELKKNSHAGLVRKERWCKKTAYWVFFFVGCFVLGFWGNSGQKRGEN